MARNEGGKVSEGLERMRFLGGACFKIEIYELGIDNEYMQKLDDVP